MDADRVIADLRELASLTGGPDGARRVCWTDEWARAREFLRSRLDELPVEVTVDAAGNLWATLAGEGDGFVIVGSHVDSCRRVAGSTARSACSRLSRHSVPRPRTGRRRWG